MKLFLAFLSGFIITSAYTQIVMEPSGSLNQKVKTGDDKWKLGLSGNFILNELVDYRILLSMNAYHKNVQLSAGPLFFFNENFNGPNYKLKYKGYNSSFRYFFPQNKGYGKVFIPIEFDHTIATSERLSFYNHQLDLNGLGESVYPGYSFNLKTKTKTNYFCIKTGLGIFIWLKDHLSIQLEATIGPIFNAKTEDYINSDNGEMIYSKETKLNNSEVKKITGHFSVGFGYRF